MFLIRASHPKTGTQIIAPSDGVCLMGKAEYAQLRLEGWNIGKEHARAYFEHGGVYVEGLSNFATIMVNGERMRAYGPVGAQDEVVIAGYCLQILPRFDDEILKVDKANSATALLSNKIPCSIDIPSDVEPLFTPRQLTTKALDISKTEQIARPVYDAHWLSMVREVHESVRSQMDLRRIDLSTLSTEELRRMVGELVREIVWRMNLSADIDRQRLAKEVLDEAIGLGPLEDFLADESITEIMVNRFDEIFIERQGKLLAAPALFSSEIAVRHIIDRIVAPIGRRIDESSPLVDARLADGSRVNAVIPPLSLKGACITIRKFSKKRLQMENIMAYESIAPDMAQFVQVCVQQRKNMIISGGTGSGECRGGEALDMLQAMNTGHDGSLTTAHANSPRDMLSRLEVMVLMAGMDLPLTAIREQIASAVDVILQITRFSCGSRKVTSICEVTGTESGTIQLQELFTFKQQGYDSEGRVRGAFRATGAIPEFYEVMRERGLPIDLGIFQTPEPQRGLGAEHYVA